MDIIFDIPASVKSLKNYVTVSRITFNDKVHLFFLTPLKWAIHAFVNVFLSGIHSRLEQDLRIYLSLWHVWWPILSLKLFSQSESQDKGRVVPTDLLYYIKPEQRHEI